MTGQSYQVNAVQCPNCGASVGDAKSGDTISCNYCGVTLQVSEGASGQTIAKLVSIADSTSFVAKTEALKRVRAHYEAIEDVIIEFQNFSSWKDVKFEINRWFIGIDQSEPIYIWSTKQRYMENLSDARGRVKSCKRVLAKNKEGSVVSEGLQCCLVFLITWSILGIAALISEALYRDIYATLRTFLLIFVPLSIWYILVIRLRLFRSVKKDMVAKAETELATAKQELDRLEGQRDTYERGYSNWQKYMAELEAKRDHLTRRADELEADMDKLVGRL
jgi:ribosomal protein S27AE